MSVTYDSHFHFLKNFALILFPEKVRNNQGLKPLLRPQTTPIHSLLLPKKKEKGRGRNRMSDIRARIFNSVY